MTAIPSATLTLSVSADSDVRINVMMLVNRGAAMAGNIQLVGGYSGRRKFTFLCKICIHLPF